MANFFANQSIKDLPKHITPVAHATLCFLSKASTVYNDDGVYSVKLRFPEDAPETKKLIKTIDDAIEAAYQEVVDDAVNPKAKKAVKKATPSYTVEEDDEGNPTGYVIVNFKRNATYVDKKTKERKPIKLPIFDGVKKPYNAEENGDIWGGSQLRIAYKLVPYDQTIGVGVSHRIEAVQIIKLSAGGDGRTADDFGFKVEAILNEQEEEENSVESTNMGSEEGDDY